MKKILILTVTAGNGHNSCAYAMKEKLESLGAEVRIVNLLKEFSSKLNIWVADKGYNLSVARFRKAYNVGYEAYRRAKPENRYKCSAQGVAVSTLEGLYKLVWEYQPDVIYTTHFYGAIAITDLRLVCQIPAKAVVPCLDYVNSPFWEAAIGVDYLTLPTEEIKPLFLGRGYSESQIVTTGMPINEKFFNILSKQEARNKLGLKDKFTVLVMFGGGHWSGGSGLFNKLLKILDFPVQVVKINGKDKKGYAAVEKRIKKGKIPTNANIVNVGFTTDVASYLSAADCVISKMGGPSAVEFVNARVPMLVTAKLAGQEIHNFRYMEKQGCAFSFRNKKELSELVHRFHDNPSEITRVKNICETMRNNGVENVAKLILSQPQATYDEQNRVPAEGLKERVKKALSAAHKQEKAKGKNK